MAGGHSATNRALPNASTQALIDEKSRRGVLVSFVYVVVAESIYEPQTLLPLGVFSSGPLAQAFINRAPLPQRACLGIQRWQINESTTDPFWVGSSIAHTADRPIIDAATTGGIVRLDETYRRFRERLLLAVRDGYKDAPTGGA
jgi:hypothetical protein